MQCDKKIYSSEHEAKHVRNAIFKSRRMKLRIYFCKHCPGFHLTKNPKIVMLSDDDKRKSH